MKHGTDRDRCVFVRRFWISPKTAGARHPTPLSDQPVIAVGTADVVLDVMGVDHEKKVPLPRRTRSPKIAREAKSVGRRTGSLIQPWSRSASRQVGGHHVELAVNGREALGNARSRVVSDVVYGHPNARK